MFYGEIGLGLENILFIFVVLEGQILKLLLVIIWWFII